MKSFFQKNVVYIFIVLLLVFICLTVVGYFYSDSAIKGIISYYSGISSLLIVLLTLAYVVTTSRQLLAMHKQLAIMDSSVKLQVQPLPVPFVKYIHLEKIRAYLSPETKFSKVEIISRFHFNVYFKNAGTGAALNVFVFASIFIKGKNKEEKEIVIPQFRPQIFHLITENETQDSSFMILDDDFEIFKAINAHEEVILKLKIHYRNIFGSGFLEEAQYSLYFKEDNKDVINSWEKFIKEGMEELKEDITRFESLVHKLENEADESFEKIKDHLGKLFDKDLELQFFIEPRFFNVRIVGFEESLDSESSYHENLLKSYIKRKTGTEVK